MYLTPYLSWISRSLRCASAMLSAVMPRMSWRSMKIGIRPPSALRHTAQDVVRYSGFEVRSPATGEPSQHRRRKGKATARSAAAPAWSRRSLDDEGRFEGHGARHVVEVGRGRHHCVVDFGKLLLGAVALDANGVTEALITVRDAGIDAEEAAEIDLSLGLDGQALEGDPADCALRHVPHSHAGIERGDQVLLGISEAVRAAQLAGLVDIEREPT